MMNNASTLFNIWMPLLQQRNLEVAPPQTLCPFPLGDASKLGAGMTWAEEVALGGRGSAQEERGVLCS
jgi:hypothetical protein